MNDEFVLKEMQELLTHLRADIQRNCALRAMISAGGFKDTASVLDNEIRKLMEEESEIETDIAAMSSEVSTMLWNAERPDGVIVH